MRSLARFSTRNVRTLRRGVVTRSIPTRGYCMRFSKEHEWVRVEGNVATVGITNHAADALGDVVFVDLPSTGERFAQGEAFGTVESVKASSDVYAPVSGLVVEANEQLTDSSHLVNEDPTGEGWMVKLEVDSSVDTSTLLSQAQYDEYLASLD